MDQLLTIAGTVAAVRLLFAGWREWRSARRIVAVGGLDADVYAEHGCVPLQFAGSRFGTVRAAVAVTGFFMVRPKTRKQVFAACQVVGARGISEVDYQQIRPRDRLCIMLDEGEHPAVFDRSMRRGVVSFYRTVAIREVGCPGSSEHAHCVTVRTRGDFVRVAGDASSQWLEYEVTSAAPRSNSRSGQYPLADVPGDAIELVIIPSATYQRGRDAATGQACGALRRRLMRHNLNPRVGFAHVVAKCAIPLAVLAGLGVLHLGWTTTAAILVALVLAPMALLAVPVCIAVAVSLCLYARERIRARRPPVEQTRLRDPESTRRKIPLREVRQPPPRMWTGATARSMSAGRVCNATDARSMITYSWRHVAYGFLPSRR